MATIIGYKTESITVSGVANYLFRYRVVGATEWTEKLVNTSGNQTTPVQISTILEFPTPDEYEVQFKLVEYLSDTNTTSPIYLSRSESTIQIPSVTVTSTSAELLGIGITCPRGIYYANDKGGLSNHSISFRIEYRDIADGSVWFGRNETITASTQSAIRRFYSFGKLPLGQYEVRAYLTSTLKGTVRYGEDVYFEYVQAGITDDFTYPGTALIGIRALATDQLSGGIPKITCVAIKETCPVYKNGAWVFKSLSNPAWAAYYAIVKPFLLEDEEVYVLGEDPTSVNVDEFEEWADWCVQQNYTFNLYADQVITLNSLLAQIGSCGRGLVIQKGTQWGVIINKPAVPIMTFGMGNIIKDSFEQTFLALNDIANTIEVQYFDRTRNYSRQPVEVRADNYDLDELETKKQTVTLYGCTEREMAIRYAKFLLNQNKYLRRTVNIEVALDALGVTVGDVCRISHDVPMWGYSGRLEGGGFTSVILDQEVLLEAGVTYQISLKNPIDDTLIIKNVIPVVTDVVTKTVQLQTALSYSAQKYDVYSFGPVNKTDKLFRVTKITRAQEHTRKVTLIEYRSEIYNDFVAIPEYEQETLLTPVQDLTLREQWVLGFDGSPSSAVDIAWRGNASGWYVFVKSMNDSSFKEIGFTRNKSFNYNNVVNGETYEFLVNNTRDTNAGVSESITIRGKEAPPNDVDNFSVSFYKDQVYMTWDHIPDIDLWGYEIREGISWNKGTPILVLEQKNQGIWTPPFDGTYQFWIKAIDTSDNYSTNAANTSISVDVENNLNIVSDIDEITTIPPAQGTFNNMFYCSDTGTILFIPGTTDTDCASITDIEAGITDYTGTADSTGSYNSNVYGFTDVIDTDFRIASSYTATLRGDVTDITFPNRTDLTYPFDTDILITSNDKAKAYVRFSDDNITWTDYTQYLAPIRRRTKYYQVKWECEVSAPVATSFEFSSLRHIVDVPEVSYKLPNRAISIGGTTFDLTVENIPIYFTYQVGVTVLGTSAIFYAVDRTTGSFSSTFTVRLFDSAGNSVSGNIDLEIIGY